MIVSQSHCKLILEHALFYLEAGCLVVIGPQSREYPEF